MCHSCCAGGEPRYKYQERVRKKADREQLVGRECQDCAGWYAALKTLGIGGMRDSRPTCGHAAAGAAMRRLSDAAVGCKIHRAAASYMHCFLNARFAA